MDEGQDRLRRFGLRPLLESWTADEATTQIRNAPVMGSANGATSSRLTSAHPTMATDIIASEAITSPMRNETEVSLPFFLLDLTILL